MREMKAPGARSQGTVGGAISAVGHPSHGGTRTALLAVPRPRRGTESHRAKPLTQMRHRTNAPPPQEIGMDKE